LGGESILTFWTWRNGSSSIKPGTLTNATLEKSFTKTKKGLDNNMPMVYHPIMSPSELFKWRNGQGYTQKGLADLLGVNRMTVYRWEKAMREIPPFLHLALKCLEKKGGELKLKGSRRKTQKRKG
jgi:DNA-binding XRE family transcriptional regulator